MQIRVPSLWRLRGFTFATAALAAGSAAYWVLKWPAGTMPSAAVVSAGSSQADTQVVARVLGAGQAGPVTAAPVAGITSRYRLIGVVKQGDSNGYALISVDGKPPKPYRVGSLIDGGLVLHSVEPRSAALAPSVDAPVSLTLNLPKLATP